MFARKKVAVLLILISTIGLGYIFSRENPATKTGISNQEREKLTAQFSDAYSTEAPTSTGVKEFTMEAAPTQITLVDGSTTSVWAYNNQVPGPEIRLKYGETLKLTFTNNLPQETTVHWHGVRVPNAMDGVPGVTQDPIQPGETYVYEFTPKDAGTFWFHPHVRGSEQVERGLYGVLIVEDEEPIPLSKDIVWVLDDWRLTESNQIDPNFNTPHDLMHDGRWGQFITVNGQTQETLSLKKGETIRVRMINVSNGRVYAPNFSQLDAQVIAVDGMYVKEPFAASNFELSPGNRIDVLLSVPKNISLPQVQIRDYFTRDTNILATVSIEDELIDETQLSIPFNTQIPDWLSAHTLPSDTTYILNARRATGRSQMGMMGGIEWTMNGKAFPDYDPIRLKANQFQKITFQNDSARLHPMHLHGQFFKVLTRNGQPANEHYFRDTVLIHSKETVEIGLVPQDKGSWANHCHILEHAEAGMMTIVEVE